jgi:hypothetical protein
MKSTRLDARHRQRQSRAGLGAEQGRGEIRAAFADFFETLVRVHRAGGLHQDDVEFVHYAERLYEGAESLAPEQAH